MLGIASARVHVSVVFGHQVDVVKAVAVVVVLVERVDESSVHDDGLVEGAIAELEAERRQIKVTGPRDVALLVKVNRTCSVTKTRYSSC